MGLLDGLSAGLTAATKAATGIQTGQREGSALLRAIQMQQLQMAKQEADMQHVRAETDFTQHRNRAPVLGDSDYATAKGQEAGAVADAQVPAHVRTAVESAQGTEPIKTAGAIATAAGVEPIKTQGAINTAAGVAPIKTREAIATAQGTAPIKVKEAVDIANQTVPSKVAVERAKLDAQPLRQDEAYTAMHLPVIAQGVATVAKATAPGAWQKLASKGMLGNYTLTPEGQRYNAAVHRAALSLAVTLEGPRGATPQRVEMVEKSYFPQPGDDPTTTVPEKIERLKDAVRGGITKAGRGYDRMNPQARAQIDQFVGGAAPTSHAGPDTQTIDAMIRAGKSDAEIQAAIARGGH